jgi:hypothetical protein
MQGHRARRSAAALAVILVAVVLSACATARSTPATNVGPTAATLTGTFSTDRNEDVSWWFEYGTTTAYGTSTTQHTLTLTDRDQHPASEVVSGLDPSTPYHFKLCVHSPGWTHCGTDQSFTTKPPDPTELAISAQPDLYPSFDRQIDDYVTRCGTDPVAVDVAAPADTTVSVDGQAAQSGRFLQTVQLSAGQSFAISATSGGQADTYHVRCLPQSFPAWTYSRTGTPTQAWTLTSIVAALNPAYVAIFDGHGTPVWWYQPAGVAPFDAKLLSDDSIAFAAWSFGAFNADPALKYQARSLDGTLVRTLQTVGTPTDFHELQELANGDLLMVSYVPRDHVDLSPYGKSSDATVMDSVIQEVASDGSLVWSWNSKDHIGLAETGRWWPIIGTTKLPDGRLAYDITHINAVEPDGDGLLVSLRHTDAIYRISRSDGHVEWKLGGTTTPESVSVSGDADDPVLGAQHDVRRLADGTVSVHDNGTRLNRAPQVKRFRIDPTAGTATRVEVLGDSDFTSSSCCGSARRLDSGGWLVQWGGNPAIAEYAPDGSRIFRLSLPGAQLYRAFPIPVGRLSAAQLRAGMDAMAPR